MPTSHVCAGGVAPPRNGVFRASNGKHHHRRTLSRLPGFNYQKRSQKLSCGGRTCASSADGGSLVNVDLPTKLNNVPHARETRQWFYTDIAKAVKASFRAGESRTMVRLTIPETNTEQDVYRVGTLLELVRWVATVLAQDGDRVKVCVQQSMGQGVFQGLPLSLSGVRQIMTRMDWGSIQEFVSFGQVGADQVDDSRFYILIAPQNVVGTTIITNLEEMADEIRDRGKGLVLINPVLKDVPSAGGVMGVRGRKERMEFAASFRPVYHFRLLYWPGTAFPIMGGLRYTYGGTWEVYKREDLPGKNERYQLAGSFPSEPDGGQITDAILKDPRTAKRPGQWW